MALYIGNQRVAPTMLPSSGGVSIPLEVNAQGKLGKPTTPFTWKSQGSDVGNYVLTSAFRGSIGLTNVDLSSITTLSGTNAMSTAFDSCSYLTSVDLSNLTSISGINAMSSVCYHCSSLTSVILPSLTTISGSNAMYYAFGYCTSLQTLSFPALTSTSFGSPTNQFNNMLSGVTGCTVHFPSNLQSVIGSWSDVTAGFGGTNTTVLFDLPETT